MKLIARKDLNDPKYAGINWLYWARVFVTATLVGIQELFAASSTGLAGNIKDGGKLSTVYPHIILGAWVYPHTSIIADIDLIRHGVLGNVNVGGKPVIENILATHLPADIGLQGGASVTLGAGVRGPRFNFGEYLPFVGKGESVEVNINIPAVLTGLTISYVSLWLMTRKIGYIGVSKE